VNGEPLRPVPKPVAPVKQQRRRAAARGKYAEKTVAERLGGRRTAMSGAGVNEKGDVKVDQLPSPLFIEVKYQTGKESKRTGTSITIPLEWLTKTFRDAAAAKELPVLALRFNDESETYYVTNGANFESLVDQLMTYFLRTVELEAAIEEILRVRK
jgi:hypothetical protein